MSRPSRYDQQKRHTQVQSQEADQEEAAVEQSEPEHQRAQNQVGNSTIASMIRPGGPQSAGQGTAIHTEFEQSGPEMGGDDDADVEDGPLTISDLTRSWNQKIKKGKDRQAFREFMPDDDLPPESTDWRQQVCARPWQELPPSSALDALLQPSTTVVAASLAGWARGAASWTGASPAQRVAAHLLQRPPALLQDAAGRVLIARVRMGTLALWTILQSPALAQSHPREAALVQLCLELAGRTHLLQNTRVAAAEKEGELPRAVRIFHNELRWQGGKPRARGPLPRPAASHLQQTLAGLALLTPPLPLVPTLAEPQLVADDIDDPLGIDAILAQHTGGEPDRIAPLYHAALTGAERLATCCATTRVQLAGTAIAIAEVADAWSIGAPVADLTQVMEELDAEVTKTLKLLVEVARASKGRVVGPRGLQNGLTRAARALARIQQVTIDRLTRVASPLLRSDPSVPPPRAPTQDLLSSAFADGDPSLAKAWISRLPDTLDRAVAEALLSATTGSASASLVHRLHELEVAASARPLLQGTLRSFLGPALLQHGQLEAASAVATRSWHFARQRCNGLALAEAAMLHMEVYYQRDDPTAAQLIRDQAGTACWHLGASGALSLLARWHPAIEDD